MTNIPTDASELCRSRCETEGDSDHRQLADSQHLHVSLHPNSVSLPELQSFDSRAVRHFTPTTKTLANILFLRPHPITSLTETGRTAEKYQGMNGLTGEETRPVEECWRHSQFCGSVNCPEIGGCLLSRFGLFRATFRRCQTMSNTNYALLTLDTFIQILAITKNAYAIPPAQALFTSAGTLLKIIRVRSPIRQTRLPRTQWPTSEITPNPGNPAIVCVKPSTGDWMEEKWTT